MLAKRPLLLLVPVLALSCNEPGADQITAISQAITRIPEIDFAPRPTYVASNVIGLTFDDGPDVTNTPKVLDVLKAKGVKATFFINTDNYGTVDTDPTLKAIVQRIVAEGHQLGSHTVHHLHLPALTPAEIESEITGVQTTVNRSDVLGPSYPKLTMLRAPFGEPFQGGTAADYDKVAPIVGKYAVHMGWAIDPEDYNCPDATCVLNNITARLNAGDYGIILMHSVQPQTAAAIGNVIDYMKNHGYVFKQGEDFVMARYGKSSHDIVYPPTGCTQTPFGGTARAIPGTIQAEDYDNGGEGCAYHDTTAGNQGNAYRTTESADVQATTDTGGGFNVGFVQAGEWLEYTVSVASAGNYKLELRTAATATGKNVDVLVDGALIADNLALPNTGAYQTFATVTVPSVALAAGTHVLQVLFNTASENLNWIRFTSLASCTPETDAAFCSRLGKNCGMVSGTDNCGTLRTVTSCGTCTAPNVCSASNVCTCAPETDAAFCSRLGKNCGMVTGTDNCGAARTVTSCGTCTSPLVCSASNVCASCTPETDAAFCSRLGKNCGMVSGTDNCGAGRTVSSCGTCTSPSTCSASNVCTNPNSYFYFEAENGAGASTAPMVVVNDTNASGGKCIWSGTTGSNAAVPANGHVTFSFNVTNAGSYTVWGRFLVGPATTSDDSLWVRIDSGTFVQWNDIFPRIGNSGYAWDQEHDTVNGNAVVPHTLSAGTHTLEVAYRENGLKMDRFLVTNDPAPVPTP